MTDLKVGQKFHYSFQIEDAEKAQAFIDMLNTMFYAKERSDARTTTGVLVFACEFGERRDTNGYVDYLEVFKENNCFPSELSFDDWIADGKPDGFPDDEYDKEEEE